MDQRAVLSALDVANSLPRGGGSLRPGLRGERTSQAEQAVLNDAMERYWVRRGGTGRLTEAQALARLTSDWKVPEDLGPLA